MQQLFALLLALLLGFSGGPLQPGSESYNATGFYPFTLGDCTPPRSDSYGRGLCDPVNLIFPGQTWEELVEDLRQLGWTPLGLGSNQWLQLGAQPVTFRQNVQLYFWENDGSRYHLRLWQAGAVTFGAVHHEKSITQHVIDMDWEDAEAYVAGLLCGQGWTCSQTPTLVRQDELQNGNGFWRGWRNDARATVIIKD